MFWRATPAAMVTMAVLACWLVPTAASAATRYVNPGGGDAGGCDNPAAPCRTFAFAYRQSGPGDVVLVAPGRYAAQSVPKVGGRSAPAVEFLPAGGPVSLEDLDINGDHVSVRGVSAPVIDIDDTVGVRNVTVIDSRAQRVWLQNAHDVSFFGGSYGGNQDAPTVQIAGEPASSNLTFDGVDFHDAVATNSSVHMECIWAGGVQGFTVRNSIFRNCAYFDVFFTRLNGPDPRDVLLENNVFEVSKQWSGQNAPYSVNVANWLSKVENFTFRNNTFGGDVTIQPSIRVNTKMVGNVGPIASCADGVSYSHNVFTRAKCSPTDKQVPGAMSQFVDPAGHDWHLRPGAAAIDAGNPNDYPVTDRESLRRAGPPDAGAHEFGGMPPDSGSPVPPTRGLQRRKRARLLDIGLGRARICRRPTRRCPGTAGLRVTLSRKAKVTVKIQRKGKGGWTTAKRMRRKLGRGKSVFKIKARGLRRGHYRVVVTARRISSQGAATRRVRLVVR